MLPIQADDIDLTGRRFYEVHRLPENSPISEILGTSKKLSLSQSWLHQKEARFRPGIISAGWTPSHLYIFAELADDDIYNTADRLNQPVGQLGDVFEILLRPPNGEDYYEFQVTPHNQLLQLHYPSRQSILDFRRSGASVEALIKAFAIATPILETQTWISSVQRHWKVLVKIPAAQIAPDGVFHNSSTLLFSFCRYDRTQGQDTPVLSSTSAHPVCDFHRQEEWGALRLIP